MIITLTDERLLGLWRERARLEPVLSDASIERFDCVDINSRLRMDMRQWYLELLSSGPLEMVDVTDVKARTRVEPAATHGIWNITLPASTARLVSISLNHRGPVRIMDPDSPEGLRCRQLLENKFVRMGCIPVAFHRPGTRQVTLFYSSTPELYKVMTVEIPEDDIYILDEKALSTIPSPYDTID